MHSSALLVLLCLWPAAALGPSDADHAGVCPNQLNLHLWVDAQSTCERECHSDQDCSSSEKCCTNVCGLLSCVASRVSDGSSEGQWACLQGVELSEVTCRFHLSSPNSSPLPQDPTPPPAPTDADTQTSAPTLYSSPQQQVTYLGGTVSFHCDVIGQPKPEVTWEKQSDEQEQVVMRADQMFGNVVITSIGQLVVYNAQVWDSGIYSCVARNSAGVLRADFSLSVVSHADQDFFDDPAAGLPLGRPFSPADCSAAVERGDCGEKRVDWFFDPARGSCHTFTHGGCEGRNRFHTFEECRASCQREGQAVCSLPAVQGPCRHWQARWFYNSLTERCEAFLYGGCSGNKNSFGTRRECDAHCPTHRPRPCRSCRHRGRIMDTLCSSDFAIVGQLTELIQELDSGMARFHLQQVLRDEKMGLQLFRTQHLEVLLPQVDWSCPCPNITQLQLPLLVMGVVQDGAAILLPHSYARPVSERRLMKIHEALDKNICGTLRRLQD
uniref:Isoform 2 of WAP, Kazal, immunoglobulin, Kunitz and NTR domain-containing protein n=1 Tax=Danio rerio TaxID=7955 RepID=Q6NUX0-2